MLASIGVPDDALWTIISVLHHDAGRQLGCSFGNPNGGNLCIGFFQIGSIPAPGISDTPITFVKRYHKRFNQHLNRHPRANAWQNLAFPAKSKLWEILASDLSNYLSFIGAMASRTGSADLPLHSGRVPRWLGDRMTKLGAVISEAVVYHFGRDELLRRLAQPFWFQSFGAVMGMDWHSSGITTSVWGALKRGLRPLEKELGIYMCGGRGKFSRAVPGELVAIGERTGLDGDALAQTSRLVAKVDSAAVQDGFDLYLHGFIVTAEGHWAVVQQGMKGDLGLARRYHWLSEGLENFLDEPHTAIDGKGQGQIINLTDRRARKSRHAQLDLISSLGPDGVIREFRGLERRAGRSAPAQLPLPHLQLPSHHDVRSADVVLRRLHGNFSAAAERGPIDFSDLLLTPGVGARTVRALALVAEVVHGAPSRFSDPARFSFAHGGKDAHPFPVPVKVYDETIRILKSAVGKAKLGHSEELAALRRLDDQARQLEHRLSGLSFDTLMEEEHAHSHFYGGRSVLGEAQATVSRSLKRQR